MNVSDRKQHWEKIYQTKRLEEVSWYQEVPTVSLDYLHQYAVKKSDRIIDVGGGDSYFVDHLLRLGYTQITVLDVSAAAIERAKERLGADAGKVTWIVADAAAFVPTEKYDFWHDRAAFHFLTDEEEIEAYLTTAHRTLRPEGRLVLGTFSKQGPEKCSGIKIKQYSDRSLADRLSNYFDQLDCIEVEHETPAKSIQHFVFCSFECIPER